MLGYGFRFNVDSGRVKDQCGATMPIPAGVIGRGLEELVFSPRADGMCHAIDAFAASKYGEPDPFQDYVFAQVKAYWRTKLDADLSGAP